MQKELEALLEEATNEANAGNLEKATELLNQAKDIKEQIQASAEEPTNPEEDPATEEVVEEEEPAKEDEADEEESKEEDEEEKLEQRSKGENKMREIPNPNNEVSQEFVQFLRTPNMNTENRSFTTIEGAVLIPEDIKTQPKDKPNTVVDMRELATKVPVTTSAGKYPILKATKDVMISVAELQANPELGNPQFEDVRYDITTYRGFIPVSKELIADAEYDVVGLVNRNIDRISLNTSNKEICGELKTFAPKTITKLSDLKTIINVNIDPAYDVKIVVSQSMFNALDQEVVTDGRPLLQPDMTKASNYSILGREVIVVPDTYLGTAGQAKLFVGDVRQAVVFFDRAQEALQWENVGNYGQHLVGVVRFDAVKADADAGFFVTLTAPTEG